MLANSFAGSVNVEILERHSFRNCNDEVIFHVLFSLH